ncbi:hypothetical protein PNOK_0029900 [Pyrrhoderma noxium]|uniref:Uncharacterized protein n=1 Tax=Pyrrhoderma noxium TaxID=2282107 RepID=A0A286UUH8_9AGAM|nr:hypothetical protein PNOK_0029900 [Pyrrhoderma noxium]
MPSAVSLLDQGHEHATNANEYYSRGLLIPASEEHNKAAEAFQACVDQSSNEHTQSTLRKLCLHHSSVAKELQRRIAKLREEGKDPTQPQISQSPRSTSKFSHESNSFQEAVRGRNMDASTNTVEESFMVLNKQVEPNGEDPFDLFWKVTGEIMANLSQPMSFAAIAALDAVENRTVSSNAGSDVSHTNPVESSVASNVVSNPNDKSEELLKAMNDDLGLDDGDDDYDSFDDFCLVPASSEELPSMRLKKENIALKAKIEAMEKQMASVQRQVKLRNEQDQQLRDNIALARREAQRAMAASTSFGGPSMHSLANLTSLGANGTQGALNRDKEAYLLRRIRDLEDEIRLVKSENEKQKAMIAKFRDKWERLKESAKRKKSAKAAGNLDSGVRERIDEDPEAEAAASLRDLRNCNVKLSYSLIL